MRPALLAVAMLAVACGNDVTGPDQQAPESARACGVDYTTFGEGFLVSRCQGCHASTSPDRRDAPPEITFDNESDALAMAPRIRARVVEERSMPPGGGGLSDDELALLSEWLDCAAPAQ